MQKVIFKEESVQSSSAPSPPWAQTATLSAFRNYRSLSLRLAPGFNVLSGANAQGKTNFLEALALVATTRLLRGRKDSEAILAGEDRAKVEIELAPNSTALAIFLEAGIKKKATVNGMSLPRAADLIGRLPAVCMTAEDMALTRGEPSHRRLFLDLELSAYFPSYLRHLSVYKRALEQRNALLRHSAGFVPSETVEPWEEQLAEHGIPVREIRRSYLERLVPVAQSVHAQMGEGEALSLAYVQNDPAADQQALRAALAAGRANDAARGGTGVGPHRDDIEIVVDGREARHFGSQGQQRTAVIAMKLATLELAREELGHPPLLLLDDILSDLDEKRRALLVEAVLQRAGQAVLTCTEASAAGERILSQAAVFEVQAGTIRAR